MSIRKLYLLCRFFFFEIRNSILMDKKDRTNISVAIIPMANEFKWTNSEQGAILSAFFWGYMMTQV